MRARSESTEALVLRSIDYGDADRILTLLTTGHGKVSAIARSARRSRKRFAALSPFCVLRVDLALGSGELGTLVSAELSRPFPAILDDLDKLTVAGAAMELVRELTPIREPDAAVFATTVSMLAAIDAASGGLDALWVGFCLRLMSAVGFAPGLDACGQCGRSPRADQSGTFDPRAGALCCKSCGGRGLFLSASTLGRMRQAVGPDWFRAFDGCDPPALDSARRATREVIEHRLERRLRAQPWRLPVDSGSES